MHLTKKGGLANIPAITPCAKKDDIRKKRRETEYRHMHTLDFLLPCAWLNIYLINFFKNINFNFFIILFKCILTQERVDLRYGLAHIDRVLLLEQLMCI